MTFLMLSENGSCLHLICFSSSFHASWRWYFASLLDVLCVSTSTVRSLMTRRSPPCRYIISVMFRIMTAKIIMSMKKMSSADFLCLVKLVNNSSDPWVCFWIFLQETSTYSIRNGFTAFCFNCPRRTFIKDTYETEPITKLMCGWQI